VPQGRLPQRPLHPLRHVAFGRQPVQPRAVGHVVEDGLGEGVRLLEHHAHLAAQRHGVRAFENTETPSSRMSPAWRVGGISSFNRFTERKKVLLPQPDGPIRAVTARRGMATVTSNNAWVAPYQKLYARTSRIGVGRSERRTD